MEAGQKETKSLRSLYVRVLNALRNQNSGVNRPLNQSTGPPRFKIQIFLVSFVYMFHVDLCGNSWYTCSEVETIQYYYNIQHVHVFRFFRAALSLATLACVLTCWLVTWWLAVV